eukprot:TRINITY_DN3297_c0_g1_i1.p1 TRINITY_DN3297_c0_g1~~TRINITY_DN3297_c0_g1_i1.p1  ORF type:complete len:222 (+),score=73.39 TRINITY_DN3297_c0_g1_i1:266-931(+)
MSESNANTTTQTTATPPPPTTPPSSSSTTTTTTTSETKTDINNNNNDTASSSTSTTTTTNNTSTSTSASQQEDSSNSILKNPDVPRDAKIMAMVLKAMGVDEYEPKVVNQLLEFMYRYVYEVFQDAQLYADHAGKGDIDLHDIKLAIQSRVNYSFTQPPPRELLLQLAASKNNLNLPPIPTKFGVHLPPEEYCLIAPNYQIDPKGKKEKEKKRNASAMDTS